MHTISAADRLILDATKRAKTKLGKAWDTCPYMRDPQIALELLALMAQRDADVATVATAQTLILAASKFTAQTVSE